MKKILILLLLLSTYSITSANHFAYEPTKNGLQISGDLGSANQYCNELGYNGTDILNVSDWTISGPLSFYISAFNFWGTVTDSAYITYIECNDGITPTPTPTPNDEIQTPIIIINNMFTGAFTGAGTLLNGGLGSIIIFLLALGIVVLVYFVAKRFIK